jgi:hypothetical protein
VCSAEFGTGLTPVREWRCLRWTILPDEMGQDLDVLVLATSGGIPRGIPSIGASAQSARGRCRSPARIVHIRCLGRGIRQ